MKIDKGLTAGFAAISLAFSPGVAVAQAQPAKAGMSSERLERVTGTLDKYMAEGGFAGAVAIIHRKGHVAYVSARGYQNLAQRTPMRRDTIFAMASMTKPVTGVATMILVEDGKLRLDDAVDRFLPELADRRVLIDPQGPLDRVRPSPRPITVRDLLTYQMGIGLIGFAGISDESPIGKAYATLSDPALTPNAYMARLGALPLVYAPGTRFMYDTSTTVLGILVARVSGMPYDQFVEARIFRPLGMKDSGFFVPAAKRGRLATIYETGPQPGSLVPANRETPLRPPTFPSASGGLYSTADDYLTFGRMLLGKGEVDGKRILSPRFAELMTQDHLTPKTRKSHFITQDFFAGSGFGFTLQVQTVQTGAGPSPGAFWWHGSTGVGWTADPKQEMVFVRLIQNLQSPVQFIGDFSDAVYQAIED